MLLKANKDLPHSQIKKCIEIKRVFNDLWPILSSQGLKWYSSFLKKNKPNKKTPKQLKLP